MLLNKGVSVAVGQVEQFKATQTCVMQIWS